MAPGESSGGVGDFIENEHDRTRRGNIVEDDAHVHKAGNVDFGCRLDQKLPMEEKEKKKEGKNEGGNQENKVSLRYHLAGVGNIIEISAQEILHEQTAWGERERVREEKGKKNKMRKCEKLLCT